MCLLYFWFCLIKLLVIGIVEIEVFLFLWCCKIFVFGGVILIKGDFEIFFIEFNLDWMGNKKGLVLVVMSFLLILIFCLIILWDVNNILFILFDVLLFVVMNFIF